MTQATNHPAPGAVLFCLSGPDQGKRIALTTEPLMVGHSLESNLLSDDPDIPDRFATLQFEGTRLRIYAHSSTLPFVDGHTQQDAWLVSGQQVRMGRSVWQFQLAGTGGEGVRGFVNRIGDQISHAAGVEKPEEWNPREMFAEVTKPRTDEEIEAYLTVGTAGTTPTLDQIDARWPRPWVFGRVFLAAVAVYAIFVFGWIQFENENLLPGLMMVGSFAIPFSLLVLFFETNVPRNISMYQVTKLLLLGGIVSIVISLFGFQLTGLDSWLGAAAAGIIEESGKGLTLLLVVRRPRYRWTLNGLLLGATVGTGFAVFESAGYAFRTALDSGAVAMRSNIMERGILSILGGHVLWTGLVGAALWRVKGDQPFRTEMLTDPRFLRVVAFSMGMHMIWNAPWDPALYLKYIALGAVAWMLVLGFIQAGLKEVRQAQLAHPGEAEIPDSGPA